MSSTARYVSGDCRPIPVKCDPNYPIEVGDLLFLEPTNNLARPAGALVNQGSGGPEPGGVSRRVPGRGLAEERPAAQRDRGLEQHDQPQSGQRHRMRHGRQVPLPPARPPPGIPGDAGGRGRQQRRHGCQNQVGGFGGQRLAGDRPRGPGRGRDRRLLDAGHRADRIDRHERRRQAAVAGSSSGAVYKIRDPKSEMKRFEYQRKSKTVSEFLIGSDCSIRYSSSDFHFINNQPFFKR